MPRGQTLILLSIPIIAIPISYLLTAHPSSPLSYLTISKANKKRFQETRTIPPSFANSRTLRQYVNPRNFTQNALCDTRTISLTRKDIEGLSDEEILARFTKGFFGGWVFFVERCGLSLLARCGWRAAGPAGTGFIGLPTDGLDLSSFPMELSRSALPPLYSRLAGGNFMVADISIKSEKEKTTSEAENGLPGREPHAKEGKDESDDDDGDEEEVGSFIDIAFGDSRSAFAGCHRFQILRSRDHRHGDGDDDGNRNDYGDEGTEGGEEMGGSVKIVYPSLACNPTKEDAKFPRWVCKLHVLYARLLFWDGIREVLR